MNENYDLCQCFEYSISQTLSVHIRDLSNIPLVTQFNNKQYFFRRCFSFFIEIPADATIFFPPFSIKSVFDFIISEIFFFLSLWYGAHTTLNHRLALKPIKTCVVVYSYRPPTRPIPILTVHVLNKNCFDNVTASESIRHLGKIQTYRVNRFVHEIPVSKTNTPKKHIKRIQRRHYWHNLHAFYRLFSNLFEKKQQQFPFIRRRSNIEHTNKRKYLIWFNVLILFAMSVHTDLLWLGYEHQHVYFCCFDFFFLTNRSLMHSY